MPKAKPKRAPIRTSFKAGNPFASKPKAELDADLPAEQSAGTEITPLQLLALTKFASIGVRPADMRFVVNMDRDIWQSYCASHPEVADAIAKGEGQMHDRIAATLYRKAVKGDFLSAALLMNGRFGYKPAPGESASGSNVQVNIVNIPGAQPADQYLEGDVIDDDNEPIPGVTVVDVPTPSKLNGATPPEPEPTAPPPVDPPAPRPPQSPESAAACRAFERAVGIDLGRKTFTEAEWERFNKTRRSG